MSVDNVLRGVTPFDLKLPAGSTIEVQLSHDGYLTVDDKLTISSANESHAWELQRK